MVTNTEAGLSDQPVDREEHRRRDELIQRIEEMFAVVIDPVTAALDDAGSYLTTTAAIDATPGDDLDPSVAAYDLAAATRQRELAAGLDSIVATVRTGVAAMRDLARRPLNVMAEREQFRFWLREARGQEFGRRRFEFSPMAAIEVSETYVLDRREFFTQLLVQFIQRWEVQRAAELRAEGATPELIEQLARITGMPSWRALTEVEEIPLDDEAALTMVAVGCIVGAWEPFPPVDQIAMYQAEIEDPAEIPFLQPGPVLLGVVDAYSSRAELTA